MVDIAPSLRSEFTKGYLLAVSSLDVKLDLVKLAAARDDDEGVLLGPERDLRPRVVAQPVPETECKNQQRGKGVLRRRESDGGSFPIILLCLSLTSWLLTSFAENREGRGGGERECEKPRTVPATTWSGNRRAQNCSRSSSQTQESLSRAMRSPHRRPDPRSTGQRERERERGKSEANRSVSNGTYHAAHHRRRNAVGVCF